jgi:tetratricopeptide (TPR) repeat protein
MEYRPKSKSRNPLVTAALFALLAGMMGLLVLLFGILVGRIKYQPTTLVDQFRPTVTPTATRPPEHWLATGDTYFTEGKLQQAVEAYEQAIKSNPTDKIALIRQARILVYTRDTAKAVARGAQAVVLDPNNPENLAYYCRALDWEARFEEAFSACNCAIETAPNYAEGYAFMAEVYADLGNVRQATEYAEKALALNYHSVDAHRNMGWTLQTRGRYAEAAESYENAITLNPTLAPLYIEAGNMYHELEEYDKALKYFKQAIKLNPFDPEAYDLLGWSFFYDGQYVRALDALEQGVGVDPTYSRAWGHMALVYYNRRNFEAATDYFPMAIKLAESEALDRIRRIEIYGEVPTMLGQDTVPILHGSFVKPKTPTDLHLATIKPVNYQAGRPEEIDVDQTCGELLAAMIQRETDTFLGPAHAITFTQTFSRAGGAATLDPTTGKLFIKLDHFPRSPTKLYEIKVSFWPNRTDSVGSFQPEGDGTARIEIQFDQGPQAPLEYYYTLGLAYTYLDPPDCEKAIPPLLTAVRMEGAHYNPAWSGLRTCPSPDSPPTPVPTPTPWPTATRAP